MIPVDALSRRRLFDVLVRSETFLWRRVEEILRSTAGISLVELTTLRAVDAVGDGARVTDLVRLLGISVGAASKAVDRLEQAGLARRSPAPDDRRSSLISLTEKGRTTLTTGEEAMEQAFEPIFGAAGTDVPALTAALNDVLTHTTDQTTEAKR